MKKALLLLTLITATLSISAQIPREYPEPTYAPDGSNLIGYHAQDGEGKYYLVIQYQYEDAEKFSKLTNVAPAKYGGLWGLINNQNVPVTGFIYDKMSGWPNDAGLYIVMRDGKYGVIDGDGIACIPCKYDSMFDLNNGWYEVYEGDKSGYIHYSGAYASDYSDYEKKRANLE